MALTPVQIRNVDLPKTRLRGYRRRDVEELVEELSESIEKTRRERAQLSNRVQELEAEAVEHRKREMLLRSTLVAAERAGQEMKDQARRESDLIVKQAHAESRRVTRESAAENRRLEEDVSKIRTQLTAAFEMLGASAGDESKKSEEATSSTEPTALGEALDGGIRSVTRHDAPSEARS